MLCIIATSPTLSSGIGLIQRKRLLPMGGVLNAPPSNPNDHNQGKAIYINESGFYAIVRRLKKPERGTSQVSS